MESKAGALRKGQPTKPKVVCSESSADNGVEERLQKAAKKSTVLGVSMRQRKLQRCPRGEGGEGDNNPESQDTLVPVRWFQCPVRPR